MAGIWDQGRGSAKRIKGLRDKGQLTEGVSLTRSVVVAAEVREPDFAVLPDWLVPSTPDDRIIGGVLQIQAGNPRAVVVLIANDLNIQNKAEALGLPFVEVPAALSAGSSVDA
jgi:predicted ribonuclease YlaK